MSHSTPDNTFRPARPRARDLSTPQLRALRKELLIVRAGVERAEMTEAIAELRHTATRLKWLRFIATGFGRSHGHGSGVLGIALKQYPLIASVVSAIMAKPVRKGLLRSIGPGLKWGSLALAGWEGWRVWQRVRRKNATAAASAPQETTTDDSGY